MRDFGFTPGWARQHHSQRDPPFVLLVAEHSLEGAHASVFVMHRHPRTHLPGPTMVKKNPTVVGVALFRPAQSLQSTPGWPIVACDGQIRLQEVRSRTLRFLPQLEMRPSSHSAARVTGPGLDS